MTDERTNETGGGVLDELAAAWREEATRLVDLSDDQLFADMGKQLAPIPGEPLGAMPSPALLARRAKDWIEKHREQICKALKRSEKVRAFMTKRNAYDRVAAATLIAGALLAHMTEVIVPFPLILAVILGRLGLETTCGSDWGN